MVKMMDFDDVDGRRRTEGRSGRYGEGEGGERRRGEGWDEIFQEDFEHVFHVFSTIFS